MARKIVFINNKGGTSKTTSVFNIAHALKNKGKKVCVLDLDAQSNISTSFGIRPEETLNNHIGLLLEGKKSAIELKRTMDNIDIIPSHLDLSFSELNIFMVQKREEALIRGMKDIENNYDFILLDTAPNLLTLTQNALSFANELIIPTQAEYYSMLGATQLLNFITDRFTKILNPDIKFIGAFITNYDIRKKATRDIEKRYIEQFKDNLFDTRIRTCVELQESPSNHQSIFDYAPKSKGAIDYENLTNEILDFE